MVADFDELTGLASKYFFYDNVASAVQNDAESQNYLIYLNISNFKIFNDLFGRTKGDEVLKEIAQLLLKITNNKNLCSRIISDWFGLYLPQKDFSEELLNNITTQLNLKFKSETMPLIIHFGITQLTKDSQNISQAAGCARRALKSIKGDSINTIAYYDKAFMEKEEKDRKITKAFDSALKNGEFKIFLQPQISSDNELKGAEALVRWVNSNNEIIPPGDFIDTLEKTGLISRLDSNIWEQAAELLQKWQGTEKENLYLSINISVKDFNYLDVYSICTDLTKRYNIPPQKLRLEITESVIMSNPEVILGIIRRLREYGFYIEVDDFGKGYSSLSLLKDIEVDMIKIDMDFLKKTKNTKKSEIILESIISMSKRLNIDVLTEGVETKAQQEFLTSVGCNMFQGYYYDKPLSVENFNSRYFNKR